MLPGGDAMTREYSGTGLGLSIVKELCKLLGGEIVSGQRTGQRERVHHPAALAICRHPKLESPLADGLDDLTKPRRAEYERPLVNK